MLIGPEQTREGAEAMVETGKRQALSEVHSMDNLEELRRGYEKLMRQCEKCRNPSIYPTCSIAKGMFEISAQIDSKAPRSSGGETDERN